MQELKASRLSQTEAVSLKQLAAGAPQSSISSEHIRPFQETDADREARTNLESDAARSPRAEGHAQGRADSVYRSLALLESMVTKQHALQQRRGLVRERQAARPGNGTVPVSGRE